MCMISRRDMLKNSAALLGVAALEVTAGSAINGEARAEATRGAGTRNVPAVEVGKVDMLAPDVYFHEGNLVKGFSNNAWIVFADYVLVIDASFPASAQELLPKIRAITDKPIRFAFDTHHHADHAYGNQVMFEAGAIPVGHTGVIDEMKKNESGYYGDKPGAWERTAKSRPDVAASHFRPPSVLFPREMIFDDGKHRVELIHLGVAHTHGDAVAWLPKEKILFTGDVCVNGPYNFVGDGDTEKWVGTLDGARKLNPTVVCPGHGPRDVADLLQYQQSFFKVVRAKVGAMVKAKKTPQQIHDACGDLGKEMVANAEISRWSKRDMSAVVEKVLTEMTGQKFPTENKAAGTARVIHAHHHGLSPLA